MEGISISSYSSIFGEIDGFNQLGLPNSGPPLPETRTDLEIKTDPQQTILVTDTLTDQDKVRYLFGQTQQSEDAALTFTGHPVIQMAINYLQKTLKSYSWEGNPVTQTIFPQLASGESPDILELDSGYDNIFQAGAAALLVKAFYNAGQDQDFINQDKFNTGISSFNAYLNTPNNLTNLYVTYFGFVSGLIPSDSVKNMYRDLLLSASWRNLRRAAAASGGWIDASLELYIHFVQFRACGGGQDDINSVWNNLTTTSPKLDASLFSFDNTSWSQWHAWLPDGLVDYSDLKAQNLDSTQIVPAYSFDNMGPGYSIASLSSDFVNTYGYWVNHSSSCISGDALVVMDDRTVKPIQDIEIGDTVYSPSLGSSVEVEFLVPTRRNGRNLYNIPGMGIGFTSTHPIIDKTSKDKLPRLLFVSPSLATSLNPTWHSIPHRRLEHVEEYLLENSDDRLYDLILTSSSDEVKLPISYLLADAAGNRLEVASEAPILSWFPYEAIFFSSFLQSLQKGITLHKIDKLHERLFAIGKPAYRAIDNNQNIEPPRNIKELLLQSTTPEQSSDLIETVINRLGRALKYEIENGWLHHELDSDIEMRPTLILQTLRFIGDSMPPLNSTFSDIEVVVKSVQDDQNYKSKIKTTCEGFRTFNIHIPLMLYNGSCSQQPAVETIWSIEIKDIHSEATFQGRAKFKSNTITIISLFRVGASANDYSAVLSGRLIYTSQTHIEFYKSWAASQKSTFANSLGKEYARHLNSIGI